MAKMIGLVTLLMNKFCETILTIYWQTAFNILILVAQLVVI